MSERYRKAKHLIDPKKQYPLSEGIDLLKKASTEKFDGSIEVHAHLGIDPKQSNQQIRSTVTLPHAFGKRKTIAAFVSADQEKEAREAGADLIGGKEMIENIKTTGKIEFDIAIATPEMMKQMTAVAKILGPKGLMPSPKNDTITSNIAKTLSELRQGKIAYKTDDTGNIHVIVGKRSMTNEAISENFQIFLAHLRKNKPASAKGTFIKNLVLCTSMSPAVKIDVPKA
jgi:large subunit ribosomal protein L1